MNCLCTAVNDMRLNRKRFSISGSLQPLLLLLVLLVAHTSGRPSSVNGTTRTTKTTKYDVRGAFADLDDALADETAFDMGDNYADDIDNVEWHHVEVVDGIMREDHPIIMYKEDFVSEDYDPNQHKSSSYESSSSHKRRTKNNKNHRHFQLNRSENSEQAEKYHALQPEKIYFDILPPTPVVVTDDSSSNDSKFDPANIRVEVISLADGGGSDANNKAQSSAAAASTSDEAQQQQKQKSLKELLNKRSKKYNHFHQNHRMRRDTSSSSAGNVHVVQKRHPHYVYERVGANSFDDYEKHLINHWLKKYAVPGNKWNGIDGDVPPANEPIDFDNRFGGEDNTDRVVWSKPKAIRRPSTSRPQQSRPAQRPQLPPLIHNSNPDDADFSAFTTRPSSSNNNVQRPKLPPLFHNSNPEDADFSAFNIPQYSILSPFHGIHKEQRINRPTIPSNPMPVNYENDRTEMNEDAFGKTTNKSEFELPEDPGEDAAHCEKATITCCEMTDLFMLYDCFTNAKCTRSIAQIMAACE